MLHVLVSHLLRFELNFAELGVSKVWPVYVYIACGLYLDINER